MDHDTAKRNISANLRRILEAKQISQSELARMTGDNRTYISRIATGASEPTSSGLARIAQALQVTADELLQNPSKEFRQTA